MGSTDETFSNTTTTHNNTQQHTTTHSNTQQHTATHKQPHKQPHKQHTSNIQTTHNTQHTTNNKQQTTTTRTQEHKNNEQPNNRSHFCSSRRPSRWRLEPRWNLIRIKQQRFGFLLCADMARSALTGSSGDAGSGTMMERRRGEHSLRRRSKIAGKTAEIRDIWNDNAPRHVGTVRAWDAGKTRGLFDGCACDVEGGEGRPFRLSGWWSRERSGGRVDG